MLIWLMRKNLNGVCEVLGSDLNSSYTASAPLSTLGRFANVDAVVGFDWHA